MKQVEHTNSEREMLVRVRHPFLVNLWGTFHDVNNLYMVMDFVAGGELFSLLRKSQVKRRQRKRADLRHYRRADSSSCLPYRTAFPQLGRQVLRGRSGIGARLPTFLEHHLPGLETGEFVARRRWPYQGHRFRIRQACTGYHVDIVWNAGLSSVYRAANNVPVEYVKLILVYSRLLFALQWLPRWFRVKVTTRVSTGTRSEF
jgi:hypothetical protein